MSPPIFLNSYISAMWKRNIDLPTKSITFDRYSSTMTGVPVSIICRRNSHNLPGKAGTKLTVQWFQPTIHWLYTVKHSQSPSFTPPALSGWPVLPPHITMGTSFERHSCPLSVLKYQINLTQRCIRWFRNSQLWSAIWCTKSRELGKWHWWTGTRIWSECTHRPYIYQTAH